MPKVKIELGDVSVIPLVVGYTICSSLLAVVNKAAIDVFPFPSLLTAFQYLTCVVAVFALGRLGALDYDPLDWGLLKSFFPAAFCFYLSIFTNTTLLRYANLETFIVFRSSCPILVAIADTLFRKQPLPSMYTFGSLFIILLGAIGYVLTDSQFTVRAYIWAFAYLAIMTFDMVFIKHVVSNIKLSTWGLVMYNNFIALVLAPGFWAVTGEFRETNAANVMDWLQFWTLFPVLLSCAFGLAISFFGFSCRRAVSATSFTVLGVVNKLITVVVNVTIWDKHATPFGIGCLLVTIVGGVLYQQSVTKPKAPAKPVIAPADTEELEPLKGGGGGGKDKDSDAEDTPKESPARKELPASSV
eukprot:TRINITY_DN24672_c0_g1_i1.p1 TRINITY_DN24672_c0_g1~~TRINITY_DN24672_c0_g1_i1.p1  ORF type:complete len:357 (-),score=6.56 TRINITY_DN24672_c0_g1_i1:630-1700(-)